MLLKNFFELFVLSVGRGGIRCPEIFGLKDFSKSELEVKGFELVGDSSDFHFYEKEYGLVHCNRLLSVALKRYFYIEDALGSGLSVSVGARLVTLLRQLSEFRSENKDSAVDVVFYFSDDKSEGAVIIDGVMVVRFCQWGNRSAYMVSTIESDFEEGKVFKSVATDAVKHTMVRYDSGYIGRDAKYRGANSAFGRLVRFLWKQ
ncbi:hypothetical protein [Pseudomonas sp. HY7a-MNA-CIBAN-0227]|uniref:hypothetical protein n=1 Tax=Pseudomonas sp. HY7a-MNA-CIBAN-0227 TaxID=3140474 RepID=UPI00331694EE